jgi:hypothetical protein
VERLVVDTVVYCPAEEAYEFLLDFPGYANYSEYLKSVAELNGGDDGENARYALRFTWWKLTYTARSEVTETVEPERIEWRVLGKFKARGRWLIDPMDELPADAPHWAEEACKITFQVEYDADTADSGMLDLPAFISLDYVVDKAKPLVKKEARRVVARAVEDLEGSRRPVDVTMETRDI